MTQNNDLLHPFFLLQVIFSYFVGSSLSLLSPKIGINEKGYYDTTANINRYDRYESEQNMRVFSLSKNKKITKK
jgi:hypothetical protein